MLIALYILGGLVSIYIAAILIDLQARINYDKYEREIIKSIIKEERY